MTSKWYEHDDKTEETERAEHASGEEVWRVVEALSEAIGSFQPLERPQGEEGAPLYAIAAEEPEHKVRAICPFEVNAGEAAQAGLDQIARNVRKTRRKASPTQQHGNGRARTSRRKKTRRKR